VSDTNTGGPAFPGGSNTNYTDREIGEPTQYGMTLCDWFAGQWLSGRDMQSYVISLRQEGKDPTADDVRALAASLAYKMADAMLAEKARREEERK